MVSTWQEESRVSSAIASSELSERRDKFTSEAKQRIEAYHEMALQTCREQERTKVSQATVELQQYYTMLFTERIEQVSPYSEDVVSKARRDAARMVKDEVAAATSAASAKVAMTESRLKNEEIAYSQLRSSFKWEA